MSKVPLPIALPVDKNHKKNKFSSSSPNNNNNSAAELLDGAQIISIDNVQCFSLYNGQKKLLSTGKLEIVSAKLNVESKEEYYILIFPNSVYELSLNNNIPVLEMSALNFIFPSVNNDLSYGIVLPDDIPTEKLEIFIILLHENCSFRRAGIVLPLTNITTQTDYIVKTANNISNGLNTHTQTVVEKINSGSAKLASYICDSGSYLKSKLSPNEKPTVISANTKNRIHRAKIASGVTVKISKGLVVGAVATANALSTQLQAQIGETSIGQSIQNKSSERVESAKNVAKSTINAVAAVSSSLLTGGLVLIGALGSSTADVVAHKYGQETGAAAHETAIIIKNVAATAINMEQVGVKAILGNTVKSTVVQVCSTEEEKKVIHNNSDNNSLAIDPMLALQVLNSVQLVNDQTSNINTKSINTVIKGLGLGSAGQQIISTEKTINTTIKQNDPFEVD